VIGLESGKTYLGRVIRDIVRRIVGNEDLREAFVRPLFRIHPVKTAA
jgi:hypothetical protein